MKILITGGGGFLGYRLALALLKRGTLADADGKQAAISQIALLDTAFPAQTDARLKCVKGDFTNAALLADAMGRDTGSVFHLAAVVSGGAEADFDLGIKVNLDGTRGLLEHCRKQVRPPRYVFTSSVAAFGGELPPVLDDSTTPNPQTSYGAHKVCGEYLATDFSRKGFIDGRSLRLPTIVVRAGKPNLSLIHISEPTRLGMISYAVFCLKKKKRLTRKTMNVHNIKSKKKKQKDKPK